MPFKLIPPRLGKTPYWYVRGTHRGVTLDRSTKETSRTEARRWLLQWKKEIDSGQLSEPTEPDFIEATARYMAATGNTLYLQSITDHFGHRALSSITQQDIDAAALSLYPSGSAATRNRQVYTPISAVLKHAGLEHKIRRPKGWQGRVRIDWMTPDQAFRLLRATGAVDAEMGVFLTLLLYSGLRLSEALRIKVGTVNLTEAWLWTEKTKNNDPRMVFLPPVCVAALANHPRGFGDPEKRVFRFTKSGRFYSLFRRAKEAAGPDLAFVTPHTFRHTWATWMRRYGGLDTSGLVATKAWKDKKSAARYEHVVASEEAGKAALLPVENTWKNGSGGVK